MARREAAAEKVGRAARAKEEMPLRTQVSSIDEIDLNWRIRCPKNITMYIQKSKLTS
jgi:hypothetical protein